MSMVFCGLAFCEDEFFEPGFTFGGYGELHWNQEHDENGGIVESTLDFHRFVLFYGYNWTDKWSFKSEVELEHNDVIPGDTDTDGTDPDVTETGELELEQAYVNYHAGNWGFQGGVILPSVGILNEMHEPPTFLSVERPEYSKRIIPTTWFGNGFAFYGSFNDFNWRIALLEDLDGENISDGIRSARGKGFKTTAFSWTKNISASYTGISGFKLAGSLTMNDAPIDDDKNNTVGVTLTEMNAHYFANNIYGTFEYGNISYENNVTLGMETESSSGYYLDLGYNVADLVGVDGELIPWVRVSNVARADGIDDKIYDIYKVGVTYKPIEKVAFKIDYGTSQKQSETDPNKTLNIGIGYQF